MSSSRLVQNCFSGEHCQLAQFLLIRLLALVLSHLHRVASRRQLSPVIFSINYVIWASCWEFPIVSPELLSWDGIFPPFALYFLLSIFISLVKFSHHGLGTPIISHTLQWISSTICDPSGIWSSPYELCRILLASPFQEMLASPFQEILPPLASGSAQPCFNELLTTSTLDLIEPVHYETYCHFWMRSHPYMRLSLFIHDPAIIFAHTWPWSMTSPSLSLRPWLEPPWPCQISHMATSTSWSSSHMS